MGREKDEAWSSKTYESSRKAVEHDGGRATRAAELQSQKGLGVDRLVDPKSRNGWRESNSLLLEREDGRFNLVYGVALPIRTDVDTTGSMGGEVDRAFKALSRSQQLLVLGPGAVLKKRPYQPQFAHGIIQDVRDRHPYLMTEFEPDNQIEVQMRMLVPERDGKDTTEDYQLGLYSLGYLTRTSITKYGLRGYYFIVGDELGRPALYRSDAAAIFGKEAAPQSDIPVTELGEKVLKGWHAFYLQVGNEGYVTNYWTNVLGRERVIILPRTEYIPEVQAVIVGLTEGILDLQTATEFLIEVARLDETEARRVVRAVNHIPLGAQASLTNFDKLPLAGSVFAMREDIWPVENGSEAETEVSTPASDDDISWDQI